MLTIAFTIAMFRAIWKMFVWSYKATWWMVKFIFKVALFPLYLAGLACWLFE